MNKWLAGLIIVAVGLPLLMFAGNLKSGTSEEGHANADSGSGEVSQGLQEPPATTHEIYLGYRLARSNIGNEEGFQPETVVAYKAPDESSYASIAPDVVYLGGNWKNNPDNLELVSDEGRVVLKYTARAVNIVAGPGQQPSSVQVLLDGLFVNSTNSGSDVKKAVATVSGQQPYSLVSGKSGTEPKIIELNVKGGGFRLYKFTFG